MQLLFVTSNPHKVAEAREGLEGRAGGEGAPPGLGAIELLHFPVPYPEVQADTLEEVARSGIEWLRDRPDLFGDAGFTGDKPFILEDAGLFVDGLGGFPGVYSAYVFKTLGYRGLLTLLGGRVGTDRGATFSSVIGLSMPGSPPEFIRGDCAGTIAGAAGGEAGFGYDPVFIPSGENRTFAQMTRREKGEVSHRGRAFSALWDRLGRGEPGE